MRMRWKSGEHTTVRPNLVTYHALSLSDSRSTHGELSPLLAPLLLSYGKALFEVAVSQQGVMGKTESTAAQVAEAEASEGEAQPTCSGTRC